LFDGEDQQGHNGDEEDADDYVASFYFRLPDTYLSLISFTFPLHMSGGV
jgi:hypothetical protein